MNKIININIRSFYYFISLIVLLVLPIYSSETYKLNNNVFCYETNRYLPGDYNLEQTESLTFSLKKGSLSLYSNDFVQGSAVLIIINSENKGIKNPRFQFNDKDFSLNEFSRGYWGIFPINPELKPGYAGFKLTYQVHGKKHRLSNNILIKDANFPVTTTRLDLGEHADISRREDPEVIRRIQIEREKKNRAFSRVSRNFLDHRMSHPRDMHFITSQFWATRRYKRFRTVNGEVEQLPDNVRIHRGLDLRGAQGTDVYAIARGEIVLAEDLYFEGKMVVIDHGNRIFSYYMHMSDIKVNEGDIVEAGHLIGLVGSTGMSTAPHLHISVTINRVQVNPLSFLALPIPR